MTLKLIVRCSPSCSVVVLSTASDKNTVKLWPLTMDLYTAQEGENEWGPPASQRMTRDYCDTHLHIKNFKQ